MGRGRYAAKIAIEIFDVRPKKTPDCRDSRAYQLSQSATGKSMLSMDCQSSPAVRLSGHVRTPRELLRSLRRCASPEVLSAAILTVHKATSSPLLQKKARRTGNVAGLMHGTDRTRARVHV